MIEQFEEEGKEKVEKKVKEWSERAEGSRVKVKKTFWGERESKDEKKVRETRL